MSETGQQRNHDGNKQGHLIGGEKEQQPEAMSAQTKQLREEDVPHLTSGPANISTPGGQVGRELGLEGNPVESSLVGGTPAKASGHVDAGTGGEARPPFVAVSPNAPAAGNATDGGQANQGVISQGYLHGVKRDLKCKSCKHCKDERVPVAVLQPVEGEGRLAIKFSPQCGHACTIVIDKAFDIVEHVCTSYSEREGGKDAISDFDFDRFISGSEDLDDFLLKQKTRQAGKLVSLEDQMKVAVKKLVKPLAVLVPTAVQKKSEAQLRAEREDRLRQIVEIEANIIYLRVLEFEKAANGNISYPIDKFSKMLKDLDKKYITGFINKINNDFLISYNEQSQTVRFYNPSKPEIEILSREFEKWLRFNRL